MSESKVPIDASHDSIVYVETKENRAIKNEKRRDIYIHTRHIGI